MKIQIVLLAFAFVAVISAASVEKEAAKANGNSMMKSHVLVMMFEIVWYVHQVCLVY